MGSGTIMGVMMIMAVGLLLCALAALGQALICQARARGAADAVALSAAAALLYGDGDDPCAVAGVVAERNQARLDACVVDGEDVEVRVLVPTGMPIVDAAFGRSRAGPVPCR
nr:Rv3654c family TadE-like protein [Bifidobacterium phasiani]